MTTSIKQPESSKHYRGYRGRDYFVYQNQGGMQRGRINARKFAPFINPQDRVLDFGCGNGSLLMNLDCAERIGIEINPSARSVAKQSGLSVLESLDSVEPHSIDVAVSNHALEHVLSPYECLCEIRQVLKPRGRLVLCVPIDDWRTQKEADLDDVNHHLYTWTPLLLGNLLLETGFQLESIRIYSHAWPEKQWQKLDRYLPVWLFDLVCRMTAWRYKRRQILAIAVAP